MYTFRQARTQADYDELYKLRYRTYCIEQRWLPAKNYPHQMEKDNYDRSSWHFVAETDAGNIIGTIRLIPEEKLNSDEQLPVCKHPGIPEHSLNLPRCAEISRLVVDKKARRGDVSLGLYRIMYHYSKRHDINHWVASTDLPFLKVLQKLGFPFKTIGSAANYMGETIPVMVKVKDVEDNLRKHNRRLNKWFQSSPQKIERKRLVTAL